MPPEQTSQQKQDSAAGAGPKIAIRTMKTDAEELIRTTKPSLIQTLAREQRSLPGAPPMSSGKRFPALAIGIIAVLIAAFATAGFFVVRGLIAASAPAKNTSSSSTPLRTPPPPAYFATETARTISVKKQDRQEFSRLMNDAWHEQERAGTVKRIIIKVQDGPNERFATLTDFFNLWRIAPPQELLDFADPNLMVFMYAEASGNRLGFAVRTRDSERMFAAMLRWEPSILMQITPLFFDERTDTIVAPFEDRTYRNIDWRYLKLSPDKDTGIGYSTFAANNLFIFTTSKESVETAINRLFAQ